MAINQFAVGLLLVWGFSQADHLSGQADSLSVWAQAERDTVNEKGGLHSFHNPMDAECHNEPVDSSDNRIGLFCFGFFCGAVAIYLGIFCRQMVNVVTFSPKSCHSKNLSKAILTHFLECFQLTLCSHIAGK